VGEICVMGTFVICSVTPQLLSLHNIPPSKKKTKLGHGRCNGGRGLCICHVRCDPEDKKINLLSHKH
jgi:hypothetical protein